MSGIYLTRRLAKRRSTCLYAALSMRARSSVESDVKAWISLAKGVSSAAESSSSGYTCEWTRLITREWTKAVRAVGNVWGVGGSTCGRASSASTVSEGSSHMSGFTNPKRRVASTGELMGDETIFRSLAATFGGQGGAVAWHGVVCFGEARLRLKVSWCVSGVAMGGAHTSFCVSCGRWAWSGGHDCSCSSERTSDKWSRGVVTSSRSGATAAAAAEDGDEETRV